jgi:hypothetical protein
MEAQRWYFRWLLAVVLAVSLSTCAISPVPDASPPVGMLVLANQAYLDEANAFPSMLPQNRKAPPGEWAISEYNEQGTVFDSCSGPSWVCGAGRP